MIEVGAWTLVVVICYIVGRFDGYRRGHTAGFCKGIEMSQEAQQILKDFVMSQMPVKQTPIKHMPIHKKKAHKGEEG